MGTLGEEGPGGQQHHGEGGDLDTAPRRSSAGTDEHQHHHEQQGGGHHLAYVHSVEACRARRGRLEEGRQQLAAGPGVAEGGGIVVLQQPEHQGAQQQQPRGHQQHQLAVQLELAPATVAHQIDDDGKTQAAEDEQGRYGQADDGVVSVVDEVVGKQRESGVVEGRNRMEEADVEAMAPAHLGHPANGHDGGADQLGNQGEQHYALHQLDDVDRSLLAQRLLRQYLLAQTDPLAEHGDEQQGHGHLAQAPYLHQHQQYDLPLQGKGGACIHHP